MIKENKKNKLLTFLCACLMVCASALGLVQAVGTTFASSPTAYNVTTSTFNYKDANFLNQFDFYFSNIGNGVGFATSIAMNITLYNMDGTPSSFLITDGAVAGGAWPGLSFIYTLSNNTVLFDNCGANYSGTQQRLVIGSSSNTPNINFSNLSNFDFLILNLYDTTTGLNYLLCNERLVNFHKVYYEGMNSFDPTSIYNNGYNNGYNEGYEEGELEGYENGYQEGVDFGYTQGVNAVLNNPNNYGLYTQAQYNQNYTDGYNAGVTQGQNNVINNPNDFGLNTNQQLQDSYDQGFVDGEQSSDAYQNGYDTGYSDGSNAVLNNPNNYNLYTQAQYEQNYQDGYNQGVLSAQYGVFANVRITGGFAYQLTDDTIYSVSISNDDFNFANGIITPKQTLIDKYDTFMELLSQQSNVRFKQANINFNDLNFIYNSDIDINFVNLNSLNDTSTAFFYATVNDSNGFFCRTYTPVLNNGIVAGYNIVNYDNIVDGSLITQIRYNLFSAPPVVNDVLVPGNYILKPNNLLVYEKSIAFDNGYDVGYADGTSSEVVNNAYDKGYTDGNRVGYQQGLSNGLAKSNDYTFFGLIGAVIDAPIQYLSSLFNFNILGFNLFAFITSLFTVCVIIWIVKMLLGGK